MTNFVKIIPSPIGPLTIVANHTALLSLSWGDVPQTPSISIKKDNAIIKMTEKQLNEYFLGKRKSFDIPLAPAGTHFQEQVWRELLKIPFGKTITYGEQARRIGNPKSSRAVGAANGRNPIGIIIPCHRVIGASGHLTGFAGGLEIKSQLLTLESARFTSN